MNDICLIIPTHNRPDAVKAYLNILYKENSFKFADVVFYDSSGDNLTQDIILNSDIKGIFYKRYDGRMQNNAIDYKVYSAANEYINKYKMICFSSDGTITHLPKIIPIIKHMPDNIDLIVINNANEKRQINYTDSKLLLYNYGWRMTALNSTIVSTKFLKLAAKALPIDSHIQKGLWIPMCYFNACCDGNINAILLEDKDLWTVNPNIKTSFWRKSGNALKQWGKDWCDAVDSLPSYYDDIKNSTILSHDRYQKIFSVKSVISLREEGNITFDKVKGFLPYCKRVTKTSILWFYIAAFIPRSFLKIMKKLYHYF